MTEHSPVPTPGRAVYGFAMYLSFKMFFILYVVWAAVPEKWFKLIGITCLPERYWAVTIPIFLLNILAIFAFFIYPSLGLCMTPSLDDLRTVHDDLGIQASNVHPSQVKKSECSCASKTDCFKMEYEMNSGDFERKVIPPVKDLNMWDVSDHLYFK